MVRQVVTRITDDTDLVVMALMTHPRVRHVPVVESGLLKGTVAILRGAASCRS
jgi:CBS domain-containing protein